MAHAQKPDFVFWRNVLVHLNKRGRQFSRLLATEVCASAVVMLDTPCSEVVWRVLATHCIRQYALHFPSLRHLVPSHFNRSLRSMTFAQRRNRLTRHFSEGIPVVTRRMTVQMWSNELLPLVGAWHSWSACPSKPSAENEGARVRARWTALDGRTAPSECLSQSCGVFLRRTGRRGVRRFRSEFRLKYILVWSMRAEDSGSGTSSTR